MRIKRALPLLLALGVLMSATALAAGPAITVSTAAAEPGEDVEITVSLSGNPGIVGMNLDVTYDSALTLKQVRDGGILGSAYHNTGELGKNPYRLSWGDLTAASNITANGTAVTLVFTVDGAASGTLPVSVDYAHIADAIFDVNLDPVDFTVANGGVTVSGGTGPVNPPVHTHSMTHTAAKAATCEAAGNAEHWTCSGCGRMFSDAGGANEITDVTVPAKGHNYGPYQVTAPASCKAPGVETSVCANDASHTRTRPLPQLQHQWGPWTVIAPATETVEGVEKHTCELCGDEETRTVPTLGHTHSLTHTPARAAACLTAGNVEYWACSGCGKMFSDGQGTNEISAVSIGALGHNWGTGVVTKAPTATETGIRTFTCTRDASHTRTEVIPALGGGDTPVDPQPKPEVVTGGGSSSPAINRDPEAAKPSGNDQPATPVVTPEPGTPSATPEPSAPAPADKPAETTKPTGTTGSGAGKTQPPAPAAKDPTDKSALPQTGTSMWMAAPAAALGLAFIGGGAVLNRKKK